MNDRLDFQQMILHSWHLDFVLWHNTIVIFILIAIYLCEMKSIMQDVYQEAREEQHIGLFFDGSTSVNTKHHLIFGATYVLF